MTKKEIEKLEFLVNKQKQIVIADGKGFSHTEEMSVIEHRNLSCYCGILKAIRHIGGDITNTTTIATSHIFVV